MKKVFLMSLVVLLTFLSCAKQSEKIKNINDLSDKRICILTGSAGDIAARKTFPNAKIMDMVGSADAALAVKSGKADAFIHDKSVLLKIVSKNDDLLILDESISQLEVAPAVNKENHKLQEEISTAIIELRDKGILDELRKKWIDNEYSETPLLPKINSSGVNGTLKMGTCAIYEPYSFQSNGIYTGLDIEISLLLSEMLSKKIEIIDMTFEALIPALQSGKIDFALANFTITEERKKSISYSEPYIANDISILVKK